MSNTLFSKDMGQWELTKAKDMDVLTYKDKDNFKNNIPEGLDMTKLKKALQYVKDFKTQGVEAAAAVQKDYLKKHKSAEQVKAVFQSGLNTTDTVTTIAIREKEVKIPGTDKMKKVSILKVKDKSHSHLVAKSVVKTQAKMLSDELL